MLVTRQEFQQLLDYLVVQMNVQPKGESGDDFTWECDQTFKHTRAWLKDHKKDVRANLRAIRQRSVFCDCEILFNIPATRWPEPQEDQQAA